MNPDPGDLLTFHEYQEPNGSNFQAAQININSPGRSSSNGVDPLAELVNDMSKGVQFLNAQTGTSQSNDANEFNDDQQNGSTGKPIYSFWSIEYYQQFFNVDTMMVIDRIANSIIPRRAPPNYLKSNIGFNPDLYGPFWITVTLIFSIAISGNIANYLQNGDDYKWRYNFHLVSYAATTIFLYAAFIPLVLWGLFKWSLKPVDDDLETDSSGYTPSILSLMCIYGYSLAIYIPVSILWVIQISYLQWLLVLTATFLSGSVLILVLTPALRNSKLSLFLMIGICAMHFLLAAGFMLWIYHGQNEEAIIAATTAAPVITKAPVAAAILGNNTKHV